MEEIAGQDAERLLLCAHEAGGEATGDTLAGLVDGDVHYAVELVAQLTRLGLAHQSTYDRELSLTGRGRQIAARIATSLASGWRRDDLTRRWVLEAVLSGQWHPADELARAWGPERGRSVEEINRAIAVLAEHQMVEEVVSISGLRGVSGISQRGRDALEHSVVVRPAGVPAMVVNNDHSDNSRTVHQHGGTIGGVQMGDHTTQHNTVTLDSDPSEVRAALQQALGHVDDLPSKIADMVRDALNDAIAETNKPEPRAGFIRELAQQVILAVAASAGSAAGAAILTQIGSLAG